MPLAAPGETVYVSVNVVAPMDGDRVVGNFRLEDPNGRKFGHRVWVSCMLAKPAPVSEEKAPAKPVESVDKEPPFKYAQQLTALHGMGFTDDDINKYLLLNNKGNVQRVVDWLLANTK